MYLDSHSATGGRDGVHVGSQVAARQERCCCLPHLLRAPGVGDNALTGLLNIQTHLEPTSQSQRQHHQPHRRWLPSRCPTAESKPQTPQVWEELRVRDTVYCYENFENEGRSHPGARREACGFATGHRVRRWEGVCQKEQLPRPYPTSMAGQPAYQVSDLGNRQKRPGALCQEPLASRWNLPVFLLVSDKELQSQGKWPQGPLAPNPPPQLRVWEENRKRLDVL